MGVVVVFDPLSPFGELVTAERTPQFTLSSIYPLNFLRNVVSGNPSDTTEDYILNAGDRIETAEIGRYVPGYAAEVGIGVRVSVLPTGPQVMRWGYYDNDDGFFFELTADGLHTVLRRAGIDTRTHQRDWAVNRLDGNTGLLVEPPDPTLEHGNIWQIKFTWYGYGQISFQYLDTKPGLPETQVVEVLHREAPTGMTSIRNPNLPITAEVVGAGPGQMHLGGRQFSILGKYIAQQRTNVVSRINAPISTTWTPILAFRRQDNVDATRTKLLVQGVSMQASTSAKMAIVNDPTITFGNIVPPELATEDDSIVEFSADPSGFVLGSGQAILLDLINASGSGSNASGSATWPGLGLPVARRRPIVLVARTLSGTGTCTALLRALEEW